MIPIKEIKQMTFIEAYNQLQDDDRGDWDSINSEEIIIQYCTEMMSKGIRVSHIVEALENHPSSKEVYHINLGNSMNTPPPINNVKDLIEALEVEDE
jgi:hypothetical protein